MKRFWNKVNKLPGDNSCWIWMASKFRGGYGQFKLYNNGKQKVVQTHRMSWTLTFGKIPDGLCVLHKCDNPPCVRPDHLFIGTLKDNSQDMSKKGRATMHSCKLDNQMVIDIRNEYYNGMSSDKISAKRNISKSIIINVINGKTYKFVGGPIRDRGFRYWSNRFGTGKTKNINEKDLEV